MQARKYENYHLLFQFDFALYELFKNKYKILHYADIMRVSFTEKHFIM